MTIPLVAKEKEGHVSCTPDGKRHGLTPLRSFKMRLLGMRRLRVLVCAEQAGGKDEELQRGSADGSRTGGGDGDGVGMRGKGEGEGKGEGGGSAERGERECAGPGYGGAVHGGHDA